LIHIGRTREMFVTQGGGRGGGQGLIACPSIGAENCESWCPSTSSDEEREELSG
jgi:hypothetical protein